MGFRKRFKKILGNSIKKGSFEYLDNLIHGDSRTVILDTDIYLDEGEELNYPNGIELNRNYLIVDGNGHTIDAKNKTGIFSIKGLQIKLQNITFINASNIGAITNDCGAKDEISGLHIVNCTFRNNHSKKFGGAIDNKFPLTIDNVNFYENNCKENGGAISNDSILNIKNSSFKNNESYSIYNKNELTIIDSTFNKTKDEEIYSAEENLFLANCSFANELFVKDDNVQDSNRHNFKFLDDLIHSGKKEISLDFDISLDDDEKFIFAEGIKLDMNDITIDGNGHSIDANYKSSIFNVIGNNITIKNLKCVNAFSQGEGSAIKCQPNSNLSIFNTQFYDNTSNYGGAIFNLGKMSIENSQFEKNESLIVGGAINNAPNSILTITDSMFKNNKSKECGAIINSGELYIKKSNFEENFSNDGGAIGNIQASDNQPLLSITDSNFIKNNSERDSGAIANSGKMDIRESNFIKNTSKSYGGGVYATQISSSTISKTNFIGNSAGNGSAIFNNSEDMKCTQCTFTRHNDNLEVIYSRGNLELYNSEFKDNHSKGVIIFNDEDSKLYLSGGEIIDNTTNLTAILNIGKFCSIDKIKFENNSNDYSHNFILSTSKAIYDHSFQYKQYCKDICNESDLTLKNVITEDNFKTIFNRGHMVVKRSSEDFFERKVYNLGTYVIGSSSEFNFFKLFDLIHKEDKLKISLDNNYILDESELEFFEGGIELNINGMEIDGNGNFISGSEQSRIFNITGKDITLKNIVFKDGQLFNNFDEHTNGGGAIQVLKDASVKLINCHFQNNCSEDDGGAILNKGVLTLTNTSFNNNVSDFYGGSICNYGVLNLEYGEFYENKSKIGSALYNNGDLFISEHIVFNKNSSDIIQPIYNAYSITTDNDEVCNEDIICNMGDINKKDSEIETFSYLKDHLLNSKEEFSLKTDIIFDYSIDSPLKDGINLNQDLIIEGNNHSIDGNNVSSLFNISGSAIFKNVIFKNAYSRKKSIIENNGNLRFENCKFINNKSMSDSNLICNFSTLEIINSIFCENISKNRPLINNYEHLELSDVELINNNSYSTGGTINNRSTLIIQNSNFISNSTKREGAVISNTNNASLDIENCVFKSNSAEIIGGSLINWGMVDIGYSQFMENSSKNNAGAIINGGKINIRQVEFNENYSGDSGGAILNSGNLNIIDSSFKDNLSKNNASSVFNIGGILNISNTVFSNDKNIELFSDELAKMDLVKCKFNSGHSLFNK